MSRSLDQLARNLASGMSRRKALWQFVSGLGVVAALTGPKAYAHDHERCRDYCREQAEYLEHLCMEYSEEHCGQGSCADYSIILNSTPICVHP